MATAVTTKQSSVVSIDSIKRKPIVPVNRAPSLGVQLGTAGLAACIADMFTFPLDTTKVRLQIQGEGGSGTIQSGGVLRTLSNIARYEGFAALYSGIVPGLQRQMAFSAIRIGAYESVREKYREMTGAQGGLQMLAVRIGAGITTGTLAILAAQPTDVVKVRMQASGRNKQYKGVVDAYMSIARQEGFKSGLYRGTMPNIARNCIINVGETVVYDAVKDHLITNNILKDGIQCHLASAVIAGITATCVASPVDVVKTRYMNSPQGVYRGAAHCAITTARREGMMAFYKGFNASCVRLVSWNIALWLSYEQLKLAVRQYQAS
eukprot:TRINITY_DN15344_c0_g1_i8.p1 TRINITY_DN15344_c0_g1~~TRINITY_DN15344_c0_g1_i8.p1  ORF type:complete len:321 (+),score=56.20 TRINITY_DN15344_c0_g1_i8:432-1394(+)